MLIVTFHFIHYINTRTSNSIHLLWKHTSFLYPVDKQLIYLHGGKQHHYNQLNIPGSNIIVAKDVLALSPVLHDKQLFSAVWSHISQQTTLLITYTAYSLLLQSMACENVYTKYMVYPYTLVKSVLQ